MKPESDQCARVTVSTLARFIDPVKRNYPLGDKLVGSFHSNSSVFRTHRFRALE
jgi:hypothetical protein